MHASRGSVMQGWLGGGLCRCETEKWNSLIMQLFTLIPVEWNILILGGIRWWGGGGQKIYCQQGGKSWRVGLILPNLYFQLIYSFNVQYTYWGTHGPLMKKYLLTSRIQNKACKVWPGSYYLLCLCTYCTDGEISSDLYRLSGCDILNLTFCRLDFHQLLIKIS